MLGKGVLGSPGPCTSREGWGPSTVGALAEPQARVRALARTPLYFSERLGAAVDSAAPAPGWGGFRLAHLLQRQSSDKPQ